MGFLVNVCLAAVDADISPELCPPDFNRVFELFIFLSHAINTEKLESPFAELRNIERELRMSRQAAEHHHKAADHLEHSSKHHREAAKHH